MHSLALLLLAAAPAPATRLFVQDTEARTVRWLDVFEAADGAVTLGPPADIDGFPKLTADGQSLVQMRLCRGNLLVGVRDADDGATGSGWVMVAGGVKHSDHGDHTHWRYKKPPQVIASRIDADQGNPAHLYVYGDTFFLANDKKNGYTRFDAADWYLTPSSKPVVGNPAFVPGGGGHITLAAVGGKVGYGTWIDGGGPNKGRVDVTPLTAGSKMAYSFHLPTGGIHGATAAADKVFFAPADGVCWVPADPDLKADPKAVAAKHVSLGTDGDKPLRTGAFAAHGKHVLCVTGRGVGGKLAVLDASAADPAPVFVPLSGQAGHKPLTPVVVAREVGGPLAFVFHDHDKGAEVTDRLDVVALDPNGDGSFADAKLVKSLPVGPSAVSGHAGHHDLAFDADGRLGFFTNPGDGTLSVLDVATLSLKVTVKLGGQPGAVVALGGRDIGD